MCMRTQTDKTDGRRHTHRHRVSSHRKHRYGFNSVAVCHNSRLLCGWMIGVEKAGVVVVVVVVVEQQGRVRLHRQRRHFDTPDDN